MDASLPDRLLRRLALLWRRFGQARDLSTHPRAVLAAARSTMQRKPYCLLVTTSPEGAHARVLQPFPPDEELRVWLGTSPRSRKVAELRADPRATLVYEDDRRGACVALSGDVEVVEDVGARRAHFMRSWWAFFPEGPEGDDFVLLRFEPRRLEVWDASRRITPEPFGLASAKLRHEGGEWRPEAEGGSS
ncbi:MAG: pyridoxamine 5'-phosphate oxidase family protein [Myxococcota bacterium]